MGFVGPEIFFSGNILGVPPKTTGLSPIYRRQHIDVVGGEKESEKIEKRRD